MANDIVDYLGGNDDIDVAAKSGSGTGGTQIWRGTIMRPYYNELQFKLSGITGNSTSVNLRLTCNGAGSNQSYSTLAQVNCPISSGRSTIAFLAAKKYNGTTAHFYNGDYIGAYASMNSSFACMDVDVYGYYQK